MKYFILSIFLLSSVFCLGQNQYKFFQEMPDTIIHYPYFAESESLKECRGKPYIDKDNNLTLPNQIKIYDAPIFVHMKKNEFNIHYPNGVIKKYNLMSPILADGVSLNFTVLDDSDMVEVFKGYHVVTIRLDNNFYMEIKGFDEMAFYPKRKIESSKKMYEIIEFKK